MQKITFDEVLTTYKLVKNIDPYQLWAINKANDQHDGEWYRAEIKRGMFGSDVLPFHQHPEQASTLLVPLEGAILADTIEKLADYAQYPVTNKECWDTIQFVSNSQSPVILSVAPIPNRDYKTLSDRLRDGTFLYQVDGLHRLLAFGLQNHAEIPVLIAGKPKFDLDK